MNKPAMHVIARWAPAVIGCILIASVVGGVAWGVASIKSYVRNISETQAQTVPKVDKTARILAILRDCTVPDGACTKRNQQATAGAIGSINEITYYAVACSTTMPRGLSADAALTYLRTCVTGLLKEN